MPHYQPAPPIPQGKTQVNLLTSADQLPPEVRDYDAWRSGLSWRSTTEMATEVAGTCDAGEWVEREADPDQPEFDPFSIRVTHGCEGQVDEGRFRREANDALEAKAPWLIAREVWTGSQGGRSFQNTATDIGGSGNIRDVITALVANHQDATQGGQSVVHLPAVAFGSLSDLIPLLRTSNDRIVDAVGTVYVPGPGYPNEPGDWGPWTDPEDPDSAAASASGEVWVYVTGPLQLARGPVSAMDTGQGTAARRNLFEVYLEQPTIVRWDPAGVFAGKATLPAGSG